MTDLLRAYADPLDFLTEEVLAQGPLPVEAEVESDLVITDWWTLFRYELYDWNDIEWRAQNEGRFAYLPVRMTQGYFMCVSPHRYEEVTRYSDGLPMPWHPSFARDAQTGEITRMYAYRRGRRTLGEPLTVRAHRQLLGICHTGALGDHANGWGLDNRTGTPEEPVNLYIAGHGMNGNNARRMRTTNIGLPRGVEIRGKRFGGIRVQRKPEYKVIRSPQTYETPEEASGWYEAEMDRLYPHRKAWAFRPGSIPLPVFPPLLKDKLRLVVDNEIPF